MFVIEALRTKWWMEAGTLQKLKTALKRFDSLLLSFLVLNSSSFYRLSKPIPKLILQLIFKRDQDQDMFWNKISNETNTKNGLDLKILSIQRPTLGLYSQSLEFQDQDQESRCWCHPEFNEDVMWFNIATSVFLNIYSFPKLSCPLKPYFVHRKQNDRRSIGFTPI